jgi:Mrp family chromosome partitioning ATPase
MGRTLDALLQPDQILSLPTEKAESPAEPSTAESADPISANETPYIEVGGPGRRIEGSASVLKTSDLTLKPVLPGKPQTLPGPHSIPLSAAHTRSSGPWTIAFHPLPGFPALFRGAAADRFAVELIAFHQPDHPLSVQYQVLLENITAQFILGGSRVLLISAATSGVGSSTVLLNLAITASRQDSRVVIVDANWRHPVLAERLGLAQMPGFQDVLKGIPLTRALQETGQPNLAALVSGNADEGHVAWNGGDGLRSVLRQLRKHFTWVLVDAPAWDDGPEMAALGSACDATYLVVQPAEMESPRLNHLARLIPYLGSHLGGYILIKQ